MNLRRLQPTETLLSTRIEKASTLSTRMRGLLGRAGLDKDEGLWILSCNSVHTFFMKFSIDVIFLSPKGEVVRLVSHLRPFRLTRMVLGASSVLELSAGAVAEMGIRVGDQLKFEEASS